ncbi:MAG: hypothetical protein K0R62_6199 [Nonomuraea muscovyensis]|nr:hypothetical protein [Nonomuraea muscovyensis]
MPSTGHPAVEHVGPWDAAAHRCQACPHLGDHTAGQGGHEGFELRGGQLVDHVGVVGPVGVQALDVGEDDELLGAQGDGQRGGRGVGIYIVDFSVDAAGDAGDDGDAAVVEQGLDGAGLDLDDLADLADVDGLAVDERVLALGGEQVGVLAGQADGERAVPVDQADHVAVDLADEHHPDDLHGLGRGDPQAGGEGGLDAEPVEVLADLGPAAVHDDRAQAGVAQEDDVLGEALLEGLLGHRVAAVLDDDGRAVEAGQPGQRLDEGAGLGVRAVGSHDEYAEFSWT